MEYEKSVLTSRPQRRANVVKPGNGFAVTISNKTYTPTIRGKNDKIVFVKFFFLPTTYSNVSSKQINLLLDIILVSVKQTWYQKCTGICHG